MAQIFLSGKFAQINFENFSTKHQLPPPLERGTPAGFLSIGKLERVECEGGHG